MPLNEPTPEFLSKLASITDLATPAPRYLEEPRGRYVGQGAAVVRPRSVAEVADVVRMCDTNKIGVVPYGGGTGLVGGQTSVTGSKPVILSDSDVLAVKNRIGIVCFVRILFAS